MAHVAFFEKAFDIISSWPENYTLPNFPTLPITPPILYGEQFFFLKKERF